jgi:hypothetical protein
MFVVDLVDRISLREFGISGYDSLWHVRQSNFGGKVG